KAAEAIGAFEFARERNVRAGLHHLQRPNRVELLQRVRQRRNADQEYPTDDERDSNGGRHSVAPDKEWDELWIVAGRTECISREAATVNSPEAEAQGSKPSHVHSKPRSGDRGGHEPMLLSPLRGSGSRYGDC